MKYSEKFSLEIKMKEFYEFAIPIVDKKTLHNAIKHELYQSWNGIVDGESGGSAHDWKEFLYKSLFQDGYIIQTQKSIDTFGIF